MFVEFEPGCADSVDWRSCTHNRCRTPIVDVGEVVVCCTHSVSCIPQTWLHTCFLVCIRNTRRLFLRKFACELTDYIVRDALTIDRLVTSCPITKDIIGTKPFRAYGSIHSTSESTVRKWFIVSRSVSTVQHL